LFPLNTLSPVSQSIPAAADAGTTRITTCSLVAASERTLPKLISLRNSVRLDFHGLCAYTSNGRGAQLRGGDRETRTSNGLERRISSRGRNRDSRCPWASKIAVPNIEYTHVVTKGVGLGYQMAIHVSGPRSADKVKYILSGFDHECQSVSELIWFSCGQMCMSFYVHICTS